MYFGQHSVFRPCLIVVERSGALFVEIMKKTKWARRQIFPHAGNMDDFAFRRPAPAQPAAPRLLLPRGRLVSKEEMRGAVKEILGMSGTTD